MNSFFYRPGPTILGISGLRGSETSNRQDIKNRANNVHQRLWFAMNKILTRSSVALSRSQARTQALFPAYRELDSLHTQLLTNIDNATADSTAESLLADYTGRVAVFTAEVASLIDVVTPSAPSAQVQPQLPPVLQTPPVNLTESSASSRNVVLDAGPMATTATKSKALEYGLIFLGLAGATWLFVRSKR